MVVEGQKPPSPRFARVLKNENFVHWEALIIELIRRNCFNNSIRNVHHAPKRFTLASVQIFILQTRQFLALTFRMILTN